jgi:serine/threonine protein kinase
LGVTLFEMVSGQPPFKADSAMTLMMMHVNDPVPNPKDLNPDVPNALVSVINKALAKDPGDRYQSAAEMVSALRNAMDQAKTDAAKTPLPPGETMVEEPDSPVATMVEPSVASESDMDGTMVEADLPEGGTVVEPSVAESASSQTPPPLQTMADASKTGGIGTGAIPTPDAGASGASRKIFWVIYSNSGWGWSRFGLFGCRWNIHGQPTFGGRIRSQSSNRNCRAGCGDCNRGSH